MKTLHQLIMLKLWNYGETDVHQPLRMTGLPTQMRFGDRLAVAQWTAVVAHDILSSFPVRGRRLKNASLKMMMTVQMFLVVQVRRAMPRSARSRSGELWPQSRGVCGLYPVR
jgi:hypothetical protein